MLPKPEGFSNPPHARPDGTLLPASWAVHPAQSLTQNWNFNYCAITAQWHADRAAQRPKVSKLAQNSALRNYVHDRNRPFEAAL